MAKERIRDQGQIEDLDISENSKNSSVSTSNRYLDSMRIVGLFFVVKPHVCVRVRERERSNWVSRGHAAIVPVHKINTPCHSLEATCTPRPTPIPHPNLFIKPTI